MKIENISLESLAAMLKNPDSNYKFKPLGKFICKVENTLKIIACDNSKGDAIIEFLPSEDKAIEWLEIVV